MLGEAPLSAEMENEVRTKVEDTPVMSDALKAVCPIKAHEREIDDETLKKVPNELDLTASRNERDFQKLRQMIVAIRAEA
jgi:hypothetical protein